MPHTLTKFDKDPTKNGFLHFMYILSLEGGKLEYIATK